LFAVFSEIDVYLPSFSSHSYLEFTGRITDSLSTFTDIEVVFRASSTDGLLLYSGYTGELDADFVSVSLLNGFVEFRFSLGTGSAIVRYADSS